MCIILKLPNAEVNLCSCIGFTFTIFYWAKFSSTFLLLSAYSHLPCVHYQSHISPLYKFGLLRGETQAALCEGCSLQTVGNRSARRSNGLLLCEPSLALCSSPLFISLTSLAGYMLLIKHAARLLIVNQIQFVPWARCEWASPPRTKVSEQPCQSWTKGPRHHFYLPQTELLQLTGSHWMKCYPGRFPGRCWRDVQRKTILYFATPSFFTQWHLGRNKALHQNFVATPLQAVIILLPAQIPIR